MPYIQQTRDLTKQYLQYQRTVNDYRPTTSTTYTPGFVVQLTSEAAGQYPDMGTVQLPGTAAGQSLIMGVVWEAWPGFSGAGLPTTYTSPSNVTTLQRGTTGVAVVVRGFHPSVWLDQSGTGAVTVTNGVLLIPSRATAGMAQGTATAPTVGFATVGCASLPLSGDSPSFGNSLTAAALAQASQTATVAGAPAVNDVLTVTIQSPWTTANPGVAQTTAISVTLTSAQAVSATTAATALAAALNANPLFSTVNGYYIATSALGVVTVTVNTLSTPFLVTSGSGTYVQGQWSIGLSGMVANTLTFACSVSAGAGSTLTAGGATLAGGTGFKGQIPAFIAGADV